MCRIAALILSCWVTITTARRQLASEVRLEADGPEGFPTWTTRTPGARALEGFPTWTTTTPGARAPEGFATWTTTTPGARAPEGFPTWTTTTPGARAPEAHPPADDVDPSESALQTDQGFPTWTTTTPGSHIPQAGTQSWATVSSVDQVGPTLDDIVPKASSTFLLTTEGSASSDNNMVWLEINMSAFDEAGCSRVLSAIEGIPPRLRGDVYRAFNISCDGQMLTVTTSPVWVPEAELVKHVQQINFTESTLVDADMLLANKGAPILEELLQGFRTDLNVTLSTALEQVAIHYLQTHMAMQPPYEVLDQGNCSAGELPCDYWDELPSDQCCSLSTCLAPENPAWDYPTYKADQCRHNQTKCWYYCKDFVKEQNLITNGVAEKLVQMFKGASSDMRLSYNDTRRREAIRLLPFLNASYDDEVARIKNGPYKHFKDVLERFSTPAERAAAANLVEAVTTSLDTLESIAIKNLPGKQATLTFTNVRFFKVLGSLVQDLGVLQLLRGTPSPSARPWSAVEKVEEEVEAALESVDAELPATPDKELIPVKATFSLGPSFGNFDTNAEVSYKLLHGDKTSYHNSSTRRWLEVNVTATSEEAATNFSQLCNNWAEQLAPFLSDGQFAVEAYSWFYQVTIIIGLPYTPVQEEQDKSIKKMMDNIGNLTFTVLSSSNVEHLLEHPDESIWDQAKTGARMLLNATMTDAAEKALLHRSKNRPVEPGTDGCGANEVPCDESCSWCGQCCSLGVCLAPNYAWNPEYRNGYNATRWADWKDEQCRHNITCTALCPESHVSSPQLSAAEAAEQILGLFTGGALDVRVAYDSIMAQDLLKSVPQLNMTFRSLQEQYRTLATQAHLEKLADSPFKPVFTAGVELLTAANAYLEDIRSIELKNLPDGIRASVEFENLRPFQFFFSLLDGSGIFGMLAGRAPPGSAVEA